MKKVGYVSLLGKPNVGKSTLLNQFLHQKLSVVTPKPQTTRHKILGILNDERGQILFLDTPGIFQPKIELHERMVKTALKTLKDADLFLLLVEPTRPELNGELLSTLKRVNKPTLLTINKIDTVAKEVLLPLIIEYKEIYNFDEFIPISALKADGLEVLLQSILHYLPEGEPLFPPDVLTESPERFFVQEIIREKIFLQYGEEIPYSTTVVIDEFREQEGSKDHIRAIIYVEKESQKPILIGQKGDSLKRVGIRAREEIERFLGRPVYLELWVKTRKNWSKKKEDLREFGY
ncbi:GTPase Era [candidate division TA06 bacterium]|nr:GTPase Era [candidate division TA06 bacterium]